jgi:hypothetical protein
MPLHLHEVVVQTVWGQVSPLTATQAGIEPRQAGLKGGCNQSATRTHFGRALEEGKQSSQSLGVCCCFTVADAAWNVLLCMCTRNAVLSQAGHYGPPRQAVPRCLGYNQQHGAICMSAHFIVHLQTISSPLLQSPAPDAGVVAMYPAKPLWHNSFDTLMHSLLLHGARKPMATFVYLALLGLPRLAGHSIAWPPHCCLSWG